MWKVQLNVDWLAFSFPSGVPQKVHGAAKTTVESFGGRLKVNHQPESSSP
jgi:hypothetical protein